MFITCLLVYLLFCLSIFSSYTNNELSFVVFRDNSLTFNQFSILYVQFYKELHLDPQGNCHSARLCHPIHCNTEYHLYMETINSLEDTACNSHFFTFNGVEFHQVFSGGGGQATRNRKNKDGKWTWETRRDSAGCGSHSRARAGKE